VKVIIYQCLAYYFDCDDGNSLKLLKSCVDEQDSGSYVTGLESEEQYNSLLATYGPNLMDIPIKSVPLLLLDEILTPFNLF
jgi:hypothetical protein